jgi:predicted O-methyltransferase YrrM
MASTSEAEAKGRFSKAIERRIGKRIQQYRFWRAMRRFLGEVQHGQDVSHELLAELIQCWGNSWSVQTEYLDACLREARTTTGPILECGSGLSTLLIGAVAQSRGARVWSLEHEPKWAEIIQKYLHKYRIFSVTVSLAPIRSYGDFDWYALPSLQTLPGKISMVICDGPPGGTRGGRYGLVPVMLDKLRHDCVLLLDDGAREQERLIANRWGQMIMAKPELLGTEKPYYRLRAGSAPPPTLSELPPIQDESPLG